jgi:hypothetical protein
MGLVQKALLVGAAAVAAAIFVATFRCGLGSPYTIALAGCFLGLTSWVVALRAHERLNELTHAVMKRDAAAYRLREKLTDEANMRAGELG